METPEPDSEREIFSAAAALPPEERAAYLDATCEARPEVRARVEAWLGDHEASEFMQSDESDDRVEPELPGERIGNYKLLEKIGEGGFGTVWVADQERPVRRRVALKIVKLGMDTREVIARFGQERQALAMMDHPNIAKVFDAGATEWGRPYFVMELVRGIRITDYCDQANLPTAARLELFIQVCNAVQHAHQKGIIHRDLKPSNILVTLHDGVPVPKVIDFGVAKATQQQLTDQTIYTQFQQMIGTPLYMSPEQAEMSGLDIDTRSDIYSLGVLLYELLTGRTPFDPADLMRQGLDEIRRAIREREPQTPSTFLRSMADATRTSVAQHRQSDAARLMKLVRGDLDWIVMKALEKDRTRRYETANEFANDLQRHLKSEPVLARPAGQLYRFRRLVRRNKFAFAATGAIAAALVAGVVVSTLQAIRATRAEREQVQLRQEAERQEKLALQSAEIARQQQRLAAEQEMLARRRFYAAQMNLAMDAWREGRVARVLDLLETQRPVSADREGRSFEWYHLWALCNSRLRATLHGHGIAVSSIALSPDAGTVASSDIGGSIHLWDVSRQVQKRVLRLPVRSTIDRLCFTNDGKTIAAVYRDGLVRLWDAGSGKVATTLSGHHTWVRALAVSPDGQTLATGDAAGVVILWDLARQTARTKFGIGGTVTDLEFSPDGTKLAASRGWEGPTGNITFWDLPTATAESKTSIEAARRFTFSPDGKTLATATRGKINLWNIATGALLDTRTAGPALITTLAFSPDGKTLISCGQDRAIRLWPLGAKGFSTGESEIAGTHLNAVSCLAVSRDGALLVSGATDGTVKLWDLATAHPTAQVASEIQCGMDLQSILLLPRGDRFIAVSKEGAEVRDLSTGEKSGTLPGALQGGVLSPDGNLLATAGLDGTLKLWDWQRGAMLASVLAFRPSDTLPALAFSTDGQTLASGGGGDPMVRLWDLSLKPLRTVEPDLSAGIGAVNFSPDGKWLAASLRHDRVAFLDAKTLGVHRIVRLEGSAQEIAVLVFSPDSRYLVGGNDGGIATVWDVATGLPHATLKGHSTTVCAAAWSPDGGTVATGGADRTVRLWDSLTGQERAAFKQHRETVTAVVFSPDGNSVLSGDRSGALWKLSAIPRQSVDELPAAPPPDDYLKVPDSTVANEQAWKLAIDPEAHKRNGKLAVELGEMIVAATSRKNAEFLDTLAAAYAEAGRFDEAVQAQQEAVDLVGAEAAAGAFLARLKLYQARTPYHGR